MLGERLEMHCRKEGQFLSSLYKEVEVVQPNECVVYLPAGPQHHNRPYLGLVAVYRVVKKREVYLVSI